MSTQPEFTPAQIQFVKTALFNTLSEHFNYDLSEKKRKAAMAKAFGAANFDALLQRSQRQTENASTIAFSDADASPTLVNSDFVICLDHLKKADHIMLGNFTDANYKHPFMKCISYCAPFTLIFPAKALPQMIARLETEDYVQHSALLAACRATLNEEANRLVVRREFGIQNDMVVDYSREFNNENCLEGMCCPECGNESAFVIDTEGTDPNAQYATDDDDSDYDVIIYPAHWTDDGSTDTYGDTDFPSDGECKCTECGHTAMTEAFRF